MLENLRQSSRSWLIYLMFAIIIVVFAFTFGAISPDQACSGGSAGGAPNAVLVDVDGDKIDNELVRAVASLSPSAPAPERWSSQNLLARLYAESRLFGLDLYDYANPDYAQFTDWADNGFGTLGIPTLNPTVDETSPIVFDKVIRDLVETKLVARYARDLGMAVSDDEMNRRLSQVTRNFVDEKGAFVADAWKNYLQQIGISSGRFEQLVKDELLRAKVSQLIAGPATATDAEIDARQVLRSNTVKLSAIVVDTVTAKPLVPVTQEAVATWLAANQDAVKADYEARKAADFTTPKTYALRAIKVDAADKADLANTTPEQATEFQKLRDASKAAAEATLAKVTAELAAAPEPDAAAPTAETVFAANGGTLGKALSETELGSRPYSQDVKTAIQALEVGKMTGVIEASAAFWIFHLDAVNAPVETSLVDAQMGIAEGMIRTEKVGDFQKTLADAVLAEAKKNPKASMTEVADAVNLQFEVIEKGLTARDTSDFARISEPPAFSIGGQTIRQPPSLPYVSGVGERATPALIKAAFAASTESPLIDTVIPFERDGKVTKYVVAQLVEKKTGEPLADDAREALRAQMATTKQRAIYRGWYAALLAKAIADGDVEMTDDYQAQRQAELEDFRSKGGVLPGLTASIKPDAGTAPAAN
ncbi:MAG: hypothetical protein ACI9MR_000193 [Myxococcota bacterium]|jgi:hypothetical protein